jgi:hypothetical protein
MGWRRVFAAGLKALRYRLKTHPGALKAVPHTLIHFAGATFTNGTSDRRFC